MLIKIHIGEIEDNSGTMLKLMFGNNKKIAYPKHDLHIFAEDAPVSNSMPIKIHSIYVIPSNCGFSEMLFLQTVAFLICYSFKLWLF